MLEDTPSSKRVAASPALIVEDKRVRSNEILAEVEALGLEGRIVPSNSMYAVPGPLDRYCLATVSVRSLRNTDLSNAAAIRRSSPDLPILLICDDKGKGDAPWPNCTVVSGSAVVNKLRLHIADALGISMSDNPGATLKT